MVLETEIVELQKIMAEFNSSLAMLTHYIQGLTELTALMLEGAVAELMDGGMIEGQSSIKEMPSVRTLRTGPN